MKEKLEEKLSYQFFYRDMEKVFEPTVQQENENTKAVTTGNEDLGKIFLEGVETYNQITQRNNEKLSDLIKSNAIDSSISTTLVNLMNSSNKSHISLTHLIGNRFSINKPNPCFNKRTNFNIW